MGYDCRLDSGGEQPGQLRVAPQQLILGGGVFTPGEYRAGGVQGFGGNLRDDPVNVRLVGPHQGPRDGASSMR